MCTHECLIHITKVRLLLVHSYKAKHTWRVCLKCIYSINKLLPKKGVVSLAVKALNTCTNTWALSNSYVFYFVSTLLYLTNSILTNLSKKNFSGKAIDHELLYIEWHM